VSSIACCYEGCGASVCFPMEVEQRFRQTHEWWMCPFGHRQHFVSKTDDKRRIEQAERARDDWRRIAEERDAAFGSCPFCEWRSHAAISNRWLFLLKHFVKVHPNIIPPRALMAFYEAREAA
jgi:hypothetical protein